MNNTQLLVSIAEEVIATHAQVIIDDLDINYDGIIDRIKISTDIQGLGLGFVMGHCTYRHTRSVIAMTQRYIPQSNNIVIYPMAMVSLYKFKSNKTILVPSLIIRLFKKSIRKQIIEVLAHELRHAWQNASGEGRHMNLGGILSTNYVTCPLEIDADKYANDYYKSLTK